MGTESLDEAEGLAKSQPLGTLFVTPNYTMVRVGAGGWRHVSPRRIGASSMYIDEEIAHIMYTKTMRGELWSLM